MRQPVVGLALGLLAGMSDPFDNAHRAGPDHPRRDQILTPQPEQQSRGIVLHRPRQQELVELLEFKRTGRPPAQILRDQAQMIGAGLSSAAVGTDLGTVEAQLLGQPGHRDRRGAHHAIGHEPQPRQRAQRDRDTEPISRTTPAPPDRRTPDPPAKE